MREIETPSKITPSPHFNRLKYILITGLAFTAYHAVASPLIAFVDSTSLAVARGPVFEELFKFFFAFYALARFDLRQKAIMIGIALGVFETLINIAVVFSDMYADIHSDGAYGSVFDTLPIILVGMLIRALMASLVHGAIFYLGLRLSKERYLLGFVIAVAFHLTINLVVSST